MLAEHDAEQSKNVLKKKARNRKSKPKGVSNGGSSQVISVEQDGGFVLEEETNIPSIDFKQVSTGQDSMKAEGIKDVELPVSSHEFLVSKSPGVKTEPSKTLDRSKSVTTLADCEDAPTDAHFTFDETKGWQTVKSKTTKPRPVMADELSSIAQGSSNGNHRGNLPAGLAHQVCLLIPSGDQFTNSHLESQSSTRWR